MTVKAVNFKKLIGWDTKHLSNVGETYWQHLFWTIRAFVHLSSVAVVGLLHGIFPFLFADVPDRMVLPWVRAFLARREKTGQAAIRKL